MLLARVAAALKRRRFALAASLNQDIAMDALAQVPCSPVSLSWRNSALRISLFGLRCFHFFASKRHLTTEEVTSVSVASHLCPL